MSSFVEVGMLMALFVANVFLIVVMDRWLDAIAKTIVTGVVRGVQVPMAHRRRLLQVNFLTTMSGYCGAQAVLVIGWIVIARQTAHEDVRLVAYLFGFPNAVGVASWLFALPVYYRHLRELLRHAEAPHRGDRC
jgi:hypothetical protein